MARTIFFHQLKKRQQRRNKRAADAQRLSLENLEERLAMTANSAGLDDAALDAEFDANSLLLKFTDEIQQISSNVVDALVDSGTIGMSAVFSDYEIIFGEYTNDELFDR
jgi:2-hydroxychromene-2-carboxylate isomerase